MMDIEKAAHIILLLMTVCLDEGGLSLDPTVVCDTGSSLDGLNTPICASCSNKCGRAVDLDNQPSCSCDEQCLMYGDCCYDFSQKCPSEFAAGNNTRFPGDIPSCEMLEINKGMDWKHKYLIISTCHNKTDPCMKSTESPYDYLPMVDTKTGLHYINLKCAICNNADATDLKPWSALATCRKREISVGKGEKKIPIRYMNAELLLNEAVKHPLKSANCRLDFRPPRGVTTPRRCVKVSTLVTECPESCENDELKSACRDGDINYFMASQRIYKNYYCVLCHRVFRTARCGLGKRTRSVTDPWIERYSMPILFDFDPRDGLIVGRRKALTPKCPPNYKWSDYQCRAVFQRTTPTPYYSQIAEKSDYYNSNVIKTNNTMRSDINNYITNIYETILLLLRQNNIQAKLVLKLDRTNSYMNISLFVKQKSSGMFANVSYIETWLTNTAKNICSNYNLVRSMEINVNVFMDEKVSSSLPTQCTFIKYEQSEYEILNNNTLIVNNRILNRSSWFINNGSSWLCATPLSVNHVGMSWQLGVTTLCLLTVSAVALTIRVLLHLILPELQNAAGRVQTCLAIAMLLAIVCLLVAPILPPRSILCHVGGLVSHWALLAMFSWMTAVSVDIWRMVWLSSRFYKINHRKGTFLKFSLFAWVSPTVIVLASELTNFFSPDDRFRPKYGFDLCWINQRYALMTLFAAPVAVSLTANLVLFILSAIILSKNSGKAITQTGRTGYSFSLYLKLFVLMGLTWFIGIIAEISGNEVLFYIFTVMNASQGVLLTLGSLCSSQTRSTITSKVMSSAPAKLFSRTSSSHLQTKATQDSSV